MRYLITANLIDYPFYTEWFDYENHWSDGIGMIVFDLKLMMYTKDGKEWNDIEFDHL